MVIKDIIYNNIELDIVAEKIVKTKEFQRLRKIKQLGMTYINFPSANHTRYEHSLGVYHLASRIIEIHNSKRELCTRGEELEFKMAALLHDIGHGPFSHTSEMFYGFNHEHMGVAILQNKDGEIHKILKKHRLLDGVINIILKKHENVILNKILSSGVDIDRMDYLNRDSFFTGVEYGKIIYEDMLQKMHFDKNRGFIYYNNEDKLLAENFLINRYYMFNEVYLNNITRLYEAVFAYVLNAIKENTDTTYTITPEEMLTLHDDVFIEKVSKLVKEINIEKVTFLWDALNSLKLTDVLLEIDKEEDGEIYISEYKKNLVDNYNKVFVYENSRFKKIQTSNEILTNLEISSEERNYKIITK